MSIFPGASSFVFEGGNSGAHVVALAKCAAAAGARVDPALDLANPNRPAGSRVGLSREAQGGVQRGYGATQQKGLRNPRIAALCAVRAHTAAEATGGQDEGDDEALQRVLRTPRVFQTAADFPSVRKRRELRANLLPSILRTPSEVTGAGDTKGGGAGDVGPVPQEVTGNYVNMYKATVEMRTKAEHEMRQFLERDRSLVDPGWDPQQMVAASCIAFSDLVADRLKRFRRPVDGFLDLASDLPFVHAERGADLQELSEILTLDLERREVPFAGTAKRPAFASVQVAARVPLLVRDPVSLSGAVMESEVLAQNGLHVMRLDFQPGEVRQISFGLGSAKFKRSDLAGRMSALVDPERGALAGIVRTLRAKAIEGSGMVSVLNDMLRDVPAPLPAAAAPTTEDFEEVPASQRLEAITGGARRTLSRLLEAMEALAVSVAPVLPCLARAMDRLSLLLVREVDRLAAKCHGDYEGLFSSWAELELERRRLLGLLDRIGGSKSDGTGGLKQRIAMLEADLQQQEQLQAELLKERASLQQKVEESQAEVAALRRRVRELEAFKGAAPAPSKVPAEETKCSACAGETPASTGMLPVQTSRDAPAPKRRQRGEGVMSWMVAKGTQTETQHLFCDEAPLEDDLSFRDFAFILRSAERLYRILLRYDWNSVSSRYLLHSRSIAADDIGEIPTLTGKSPTEQVAIRAQALRAIRDRVERAHQKASIAQLEDEILRLQAAAREGFEAWIARTLADMGVENAEVVQLPVDPGDLWTAVTELVQGEGMRRRIQQLEDQLSTLLPLAERVRAPTTETGEGVFWARVLKEARRITLMRKGSTITKAQTAVAPGGPRRKSSSMGSAPSQPGMDRSDTVREIAAIWTSLPRSEDRITRGISRVPAQETMQAAIKAYYLRKTGRSKFVESSTINLCRSVLDHCDSHLKVALFAVVCDIQPASAMLDRLPRPRREVNRDSAFKFDPVMLNDLPLDAPYAMASYMRELKAHRRQRKFMTSSGAGEDADSVDPPLPLGVVLAAGRSVFGNRGRSTARSFELSLLAFAELSDMSETMTATSTVGSRRGSAPANPGVSALDGGLLGGVTDLMQMHEVLFVSHVLRAHFAEQKRQQERAVTERLAAKAAAERRTLAESRGEGLVPKGASPSPLDEEALRAEPAELLWRQFQSESSAGTGLRKQLGILADESCCTAARAGWMLWELGATNLPPPLLARAFVGAAGAGRQRVEEAEVRRAVFDRLTGAWMACGGESSAVCRESVALWVGLWALAHERSLEMELMGRLYSLFDASGDGWLQFDEFAELLTTVVPGISKAETEEIFLCGADDVAGDMTKEVFLAVVLRLGITTEIDILEQLVEQKRKEVHGPESPRTGLTR